MPTNEYMRVYMLKRYHARRNKAIEFLGDECSECGGTNDLHFHHIDPAKKSFTISKISSIAEHKFWDELAKCELLCKDCHKEKHAAKCGTVNNKCKCDECRKAWNEYHRIRKPLWRNG